jgi:hypothetical protein
VPLRCFWGGCKGAVTDVVALWLWLELRWLDARRKEENLSYVEQTSQSYVVPNINPMGLIEE